MTGQRIMKRKLKMGMVGGGIGAFIGAVHRQAAIMDGLVELVCGAFSTDPEVSNKSGKQLFLPDNRVYETFEEMITKEKSLPEQERMDFLSIVTPNHMHYPIAKAALENGFHVVCEKPMTVNSREAEELVLLVEKTGLHFALTHTYTGYPMVKQARQVVLNGDLGKIRKIVVDYPQGWLSTRVEKDNPQASWRTDPEKAGPGGCLGDIGTHAHNLAEYISGLQVTELCADLSSLVGDRRLDDDASMLLRFNNGARGVLHSSQICAGEENALKIFIYGEKGGLEWHQMKPNTLLVKLLERPVQIYRTGVDHGNYLSEAAMHNTRVPSGHPEGYIEAFANIYRNFALTLASRLKGEELTPEMQDYPTVDVGFRGMKFIEAAIASAKSDKKWTPVT